MGCCGKLLPAVPAEHRALVALAAGTGLRGASAPGCAGMRWTSTEPVVSVVQVAVESAGSVTIKAYRRLAPVCEESRAGVPCRRSSRAPLPKPWRMNGRILVRWCLHLERRTPFRRSNFRRQVWRPALVRAGLLGRVVESATRWRATWPGRSRTARGVHHRAEVVCTSSTRARRPPVSRLRHRTPRGWCRMACR